MEKKTKPNKSQRENVVDLVLSEKELDTVVREDEDCRVEQLHLDMGAATICALLTRPEFYWRNHTQITPALVEDECQRAMIAHIQKCYRKYGSPPDPFILKAALAKSVKVESDEGNDARQFLENEVNAILDLKTIVEDDRQLAMLQEEVTDTCKQQAYARAFIEAHDYLDQGDYEEAMKVMSAAKHVGPVEDNTLDFFSDPSDLMDLLKKDQEEICAVTGFESLDRAKQGGFRKGELIVFVGKPGKGKSAILGHVAVANLRAGKNILFITLENSKATVVKRIIASLMNVRMDEILGDRTHLLYRLDKLKETITGSLRIEEAPGGSIGVEDLRGIIERVKRSGNFDPDVVVLDYLGEMKAEKQSNRYEWLETRAQELRALGSEFGCAMITAAQTNRQAETTTIVTANELGDCYGIYRKADMLISLNSDEQERPRGLMRLYVDKNRQGKTGFLVWLTADFPTMQFIETGEEAYQELEMKPLCGFDIDDDDGEEVEVTDNEEDHLQKRTEKVQKAKSPQKPPEKTATPKSKKKNPFVNRYTKEELDRMREFAKSGRTWEDAAKEITTHSSISVKLKWEKLGLGAVEGKAAA